MAKRYLSRHRYTITNVYTKLSVKDNGRDDETLMRTRRGSWVDPYNYYRLSIRGLDAYFYSIPRPPLPISYPHSPESHYPYPPCSRGVCMPESIALEITAFDSISSSAAELNLLSFRLTLGLFGRGLWFRL